MNWSEDGKLLAIGTTDNRVLIYHVDTEVLRGAIRLMNNYTLDDSWTFRAESVLFLSRDSELAVLSDGDIKMYTSRW